MSLLIDCAINRISFLRSEEKLILQGLAMENSDFLSLTRGGLMSMRLNPRRKTPVDDDEFNPRVYLDRARDDIAWLEKPGNGLLPLWSPGYPYLLSQIYNPPFFLFVKSRVMPNFNLHPGPIVSIVGTRKPSQAAVELTRNFASDCARNAAVVISGLAMGIDAAAHRGALDEGGLTLAFLGHGCDMVYPASNKKLVAHMLARGGALISEYPPGTPPRPFRFPQRNRLISGMSQAVVLAEAPSKSGALITVDYALEQGREVAVLGGLRRSRRNAGGDELVDCGAPVVHNARELYFHLNGYEDYFVNSRN